MVLLLTFHSNWHDLATEFVTPIQLLTSNQTIIWGNGLKNERRTFIRRLQKNTKRSRRTHQNKVIQCQILNQQITGVVANLSRLEHALWGRASNLTETSKTENCNKDDKLLCATIMDPTPAELGRQRRSHSESAAPRRSIFRDLLTPTDSETRYEATLTTLCLYMFRFPQARTVICGYCLEILCIAVKHFLISL